MTALLEKEDLTTRLRITLGGAVQGVGFRPFVYRLATELRLCGWVLNSSSGLVVEVEGPSEQVDRFAMRTRARKAEVGSCASERICPLTAGGFDGI